MKTASACGFAVLSLALTASAGECVKISFAGDVMCLKEQLKAVEAAKVPWSSVFAPAKRLFAGSDYVVANLETPLAGPETGYTKADARFNTPDAFAAAMKEAGVTCANTANNHCMDMKEAGLDRTVRTLDRLGLDHFGTYLTKEAADAPFVRTVGGVRFAFVGATYGTATEWGDIQILPPERTWKVDFLKRQETGDPYWPERKHPVYVAETVRTAEIANPANEPFRRRIADKIAAAKKVADFTIALPHVGGQFNPAPGDYAKYTVEWMANSGADLVVGAHPHTTQRCERFPNGVWAAYSLGNYAFTPYVGWYVHGQLAEYAAVLHAYVDKDTKKLAKLTFSVVKSVVDEDGVSRTYPVADVWAKTTDADARQMLRLEVEAMVNRFRGTSAAVEIADEYEITSPASVVPLWPQGAMPDAQEHQVAARLEAVGADGFDAAAHRLPYIEWCDRPAGRRTGQCVMLISGGGYQNLCDGVWVDRFAEYLTARGVQCVKLVYRTPRPKNLPIWQTAWEDGQRAVRIVRSSAKARGFDPEKIGVLGFSAGAHLCVLLATSSQTPATRRIDATDDVPAHVNFAVPVFPAYVLSDGLDAPNRTKGDAADVALNPCFRFDAKTCPMCLIHGSDDIYSSVGSLMIYRRLHAMGVSSDLHVYAGRGHGFKSENALLRALDGWIDRVGDFLAQVDRKR